MTVLAPRGRLHPAWVVAAVAFVTLLLASGFRSTPGVLIVPLEESFGWSRSTLSLAVGVNLVLFGLTGPFAAAAMLRFGVRRVVLGALSLCAIGSGLTVFMTASWQLVLLWGVVVGLGTGCLASVFAATVANRWFVARRGLVTGVLTAASATGQLVFLPLLATLATSYGWRAASLTVAGAALLGVPLALLFLHDRPEDVGARPYGADESTPPTATATGNPMAAAFAGLRLAAGSGRFWLLAGSFFVCGASTNGLIGTHFIPAAHDHGMTQVAAASLLATIGIFDIIGTTASGWLTDRFDPRALLAWYYGLRGLSLLALPVVLQTGSLPLLAFIVFYGLDWVATVPPTIALCAGVAGPERAAVVFGWVFAAHQIGAACAAYGAGVVRDGLGSYGPAFVTAGVLCAVAAALALSVGRSRRPVAVPVVPQAAPLA
ncbi:MAG: MFS transporter [Actinomycetota bacterium]|nr:MFS transporter [Actinomycetota bacterium]